MCVSAIHTHMHIHIDRHKAFFKFTNFAELPGVQVELGILCFIQCTWSWFAIPEFLHPLSWLYASSLTSMHSLACPCLASVVFSLSLPVTCGLCIFCPDAGKASLLLKSHVARLYCPLPQIGNDTNRILCSNTSRGWESGLSLSP